MCVRVELAKHDNVQFMERLQQMSHTHGSGNSDANPTDGTIARGTATIDPLAQRAQDIRNHHRLLHHKVCTMNALLHGALSLGNAAPPLQPVCEQRIAIPTERGSCSECICNTWTYMQFLHVDSRHVRTTYL